MRLRYCLSSKPNDDDAAWFDTDAGRRLTDDEVTARVGTTETWTVRYDDGSQRDYVATFAENGWLNAEDVFVRDSAARGEFIGHVYPKTTSLRAIKYTATRWRKKLSIASIVGPTGDRADTVCVRFVSGGVTTDTRHWFVLDEVIDARETRGAECGGSLSSRLYGGGAVVHVQRVANSDLVDGGIATDADIALAESASFRAELAVLQYFRSTFPLPRYVWTSAAEETGIAVEIKVNDGPWLEVDGKGVPIPRKNIDA